MSTARPIIKESLFLLNLVGFTPADFNNSHIIRIIVSLFALTYSFINTSLECLFHFDGLDSIEAITITVGLYQVCR